MTETQPKSTASQETITVRIEGGGDAAQPLIAMFREVSATGIAIEVPLPLKTGSMVSLTGVILSGSSRRKLDAAPARVMYCNRNGTGYLIDLVFTSAGASSEHQRGTAPLAETDYYDVLQLSPKADPDTIHLVYRRLAQRYHPDNLETGAPEQFRALHEAYRILSDPERRAAYDAMTRDRNLRSKSFDQSEAAQDREVEKRKRAGVLSLLYAKRFNHPQQPGMTIIELEELLACPGEHLEFTLWYLKEVARIIRGDNGRYTITANGVDSLESDPLSIIQNERLLPAVK
jgi:hypothetical protein